MNETKDLCGCCEGTEVLTPLPEANRPGLDHLAYRMGTQASFLESMRARLSSLHLEETGKNPLDRLTTRAPDDAAIAFLDAWATVADVLTFYQERIANEGYLRTATEQRSILELARLVGYKLKPGVSASAYLAFTLDKDYQITISAGTRAQTVPAAGDQAGGALPGSAPPATTSPQPFETSADLEARYEWNELRLRLTRPQTITDPTDKLYLQGVSTNLKPNSLLAIELNSPSTPIAYRVCSVQPDSANNRTLVEIERWDPLARQTASTPSTAGSPIPLPDALRAPALRKLLAALGTAADINPARGDRVCPQAG